MNLTGLHLLLTFKCTYECDHCFTWGSPWQSGVMSQAEILEILHQAKDLGTVTTIYFEGGEPFLYYATLLEGIRAAASFGFKTGIVTNCFWATSEEDALTALSPFAGLLHQITVSCDRFHRDEPGMKLAQNGMAAAKQLGISVGTISIVQPQWFEDTGAVGQLPLGESNVMFRGRAALKMASRVTGRPWDLFTSCPHENLREPGRVHLDPTGNLHICQGISIGSLFKTPLKEICATYAPESHPITGALIQGGPVELVRRYSLPHEAQYVDACHLCYSARLALREKFPEILAPSQMYGIMV